MLPKKIGANVSENERFAKKQEKFEKNLKSQKIAEATDENTSRRVLSERICE